MSFFSLSCLINLSRCTCTILNTSGEIEDLCLTVDFCWKDFSLLQPSRVLIVSALLVLIHSMEAAAHFQTFSLLKMNVHKSHTSSSKFKGLNLYKSFWLMCLSSNLTLEAEKMTGRWEFHEELRWVPEHSQWLTMITFEIPSITRLFTENDFTFLFHIDKLLRSIFVMIYLHCQHDWIKNHPKY